MKDKELVKRIWAFARKYKWAFVFSYAILLAELVFRQSLPLFLEKVINYAVYDSDVQKFLYAALLYALVFFGYAMCGYLQLRAWQRLHNKYVYDIRVACYRKVLHMKPGVLADIRTGDVIRTINADTQEFHHIIQRYAMRNINARIGGLVSLVIVATIRWEIALFMLIVIPLSAVVSGRIKGKVKSAAGEVREKQGMYAAWLMEILKGMREIKLFAAEKTVLRLFMRKNHEIVRSTVKQDRLQFQADQIINGIYFFADIIFYVICALFVANKSINIGEYIAVVAYFSSVSYSVRRVLRGTVEYQQRKTCVERVLKLLDEPEEQETGFTPLTVTEGSVEIENLSFAYNGQKDVLQNISVKIRPGERIGVVGASGVGKSTFASLMLKFYDPVSGEIRIDGQSLYGCTASSIRQAVGIVNQENIIFSASVRDNITFGVPAPDEQLWKILDSVSLKDVIAKLPGGLDTVLGPEGISLSGGQNQRLCIARMMFRNPRILILDEATSALDTESEAAVQAALDRLSEGKTTFVISHRYSALLHTDRILVLHDGRQTGFAHHSILMAENPYFAEMFAKQKEALA